MIFEEGLENIWKRHHRLAEGTRKAITEGWGLNLCAKRKNGTQIRSQLLLYQKVLMHQKLYLLHLINTT